MANRSLELIGKELGMFSDRHEDMFRWDGNPATLSDEVLAALADKLAQVAYPDPVEREAARRRVLIEAGEDPDYVRNQVADYVRNQVIDVKPEPL